VPPSIYSIQYTVLYGIYKPWEKTEVTTSVPECRVNGMWAGVGSRVSYETSFDSKQPKLESKLVSILSETRRLFRLFRLNIETGTFNVSIEPKQKENNRNKPKKVSKLLKNWFVKENYIFYYYENIAVR
jgi:hypothetical protein